jgi:hypothetical protein
MSSESEFSFHWGARVVPGGIGGGIPPPLWLEADSNADAQMAEVDHPQLQRHIMPMRAKLIRAVISSIGNATTEWTVYLNGAPSFTFTQGAALSVNQLDGPFYASGETLSVAWAGGTRPFESLVRLYFSSSASTTSLARLQYSS